jgi:membrane associated rhomboid family serine protease
MQRHVHLLGILWSVWGALSILVGVSLLLLAVGALAPVLEPEGERAFAAGLTAAVFALVGGLALLWGGAHVWAGVLLHRRLPLGRILSLALAVVNLLVLPFGTALGIYAMWVLLTNEGRKLFEPVLSLDIS